MTFDDDFIRITTNTGTMNLKCKDVGLEWPPPENLSINGTVYTRTRFSQIPDATRGDLTHVVRGAEYVPAGMVGST